MNKNYEINYLLHKRTVNNQLIEFPSIKTFHGAIQKKTLLLTNLRQFVTMHFRSDDGVVQRGPVVT